MILINKIKSQDINFSQFYSVKSYFNPGFVASDKCRSLYLHTKYQMLQANGGFKVATLSFSDFYPNYNSGINLYLQNDNQPNNILNFSRIAGAYVYDLNLKKTHISFWLQGQYNLRFVNWQNAVTSSMIDSYTGQISQNYSFPEFKTKAWWDINFGFLLFSKNFFIGSSVKNYVTNYENKPYKLVLSLVGLRIPLRTMALEIYAINRNGLSNQTGFLVINDRFWSGFGIDFQEININKINFDIGFIIKKVSFSFNYSVFVGKNLFSIYELGIKYRFKCKKGHRHAIFCPAYQL